MFSKALYKQSWKANWIQWLAITVVSCFILVIIMGMSGGDGIGSLTSSFTETFAKATLESNFKSTSINYHYVSNDGLVEFDEAFLDKYVEELKDNPYVAPDQTMIGNAYLSGLNAYQASVLSDIHDVDPDFVFDPLSEDQHELMLAALFTLNPNNQFDAVYTEVEEEIPPVYDFMTLVGSIDQDEMLALWTTGTAPEDLYDVVHDNSRHDYRSDRTRNGSAIFLGFTASSDAAKEKILETLADAGITAEIYNSFAFDYDGLKQIGNSAIVTYQARVDFEVGQLDRADYTDEVSYLAAVEAVKVSIQKDITATLIDKLPETLSEAMSDMKDQDMYTMIVGNMYFKIVGLLISVVFVIVVGVNLIAGQVDSGSMAYILSTGTKRNSVTFTQMIFFITSTLLLFIATTAVSIICFKVMPPFFADVTLTHLILFNVGSFLSTMALGAIIFFASCLFNRYKYAMALGGGFAVLTVVFTLLGLFASESTPSMMRISELDPFNSASIVSLFDITSIMNGSIDYIWKFGILGGICIVFFSAGIIIFKKKDLPL